MCRLIYLSCCVLVTLCIGCASMASLPGGPKDETPPQVIEQESTPNYQTNFGDREITVTLDEWVKLDDPINRVLISPPLEKRADIRLKGRSVIVAFDEEEKLRQNATYTINFGESILDITEGNALKNYAFVFSTGPQIDSLFLSGEVLDGYTAEAVEEATVLVYETMEDSIVFKEKPFYATRTAEDGSFRINNMKSGTFKVVALKDENLNYLYDPASESIGFISNPVQIGSDSIKPVTIKMTTEDPSPSIDRRDTSGWNTAVFTYNRIPYEVMVEYSSFDSTLFFDRLDKKITVWAIPDERAQWSLYFQDTVTGYVDTFRLNRNSDRSASTPIERLTRIAPTGHPADPFFFCFDRPIRKIDTTFIKSYHSDSTLAKLPSITIIDSLPLCIAFKSRWTPDSLYQLTLLPGSLIDLFGLTNDTMALSIPIGNVERFGNINMNIQGLDSMKQYLIELVIKDKVQTSEVVDSRTDFKKLFTKLKPGTYQLRITEDLNRNGRWDPAKYLQGVQPEIITTTDIEQLRANWDVDVNYKWNSQ